MIFPLLLSSLFRLQALFPEIISTRCFFSTEAYSNWLPGNKPHDQLVPDSIFRLRIDVITIVRSYNGILIMVLEIIGGSAFFAPLPPGQWSDLKSLGTIGLK